MAKYNESIDIKSGSLEAGGEGISRVVENKDPNKKTTSAPPPVFDEPRTKSNIAPVRTFESDLEDVAESGDASLAKTFLEQNQNKEASRRQAPPQKDRTGVNTPPPPPPAPNERQDNAAPFGSQARTTPKIQKRKTGKTTKEDEDKGDGAKNTAIIVLSTLLLAGSAYLALPLLNIDIPSLSTAAGENENAQEQESTLPDPLTASAEERATIDIEELTRSEIINEIERLRSAETNSSSPRAVYFTLEALVQSDDETATEVRTANAQELFDALGLSPGVMLPRVIDEYTYGILANGETFLVARVSSFEEAFGALYSWEDDMARELLYILQFDRVAAHAGGNFEDTVVSNEDVRVLYIPEETSPETGLDEDSESDEVSTALLPESTLAYSFFDRETVVIASSLEALEDAFTFLK